MIADLKPYAEYKESGLPWLLHVPSTWKVVRNGSLFGQRNQTGYEALPILEVSLKTGVRVRNFENSTRKQVMSDFGKYKHAARGDVAYNTMRMWQGAVGVSPVDGLVSPAYMVARPYPDVEPRFFVALFRTDDYMSEIDNCSRGIVKDRNRLYWDQFKQILSPCPPPAEQAAIVRFLDWANGRLERAIRAKRKVIALLSEQKQAIIHRAVTRGLDPSVPLKPSGIPWLGDIPQHWEVQRLKWVLRLQRGFDLPADRRKTGSVPVYSSGGHIDNHNVALANPPGVVIGRYGSTDAVFFVTEPYWPHNTALFTTTFYENQARWCFYLLRSIAKGAYAGKSAVPGVDRKDLFDIVVPRPPVEEQRAIAVAIDNQLTEFERSISTITKEIELLREYRTRLVADVVTGKLDVREAAARLPDEAAPDRAGDDSDPSLDPEAADEETAV
jgi:type I restriction enzyme, S subunit